jgi:hypothetical protein
MKGAILSFKRQNKTNHFCVLGLLWNNGRYELPVFWMEKNRECLRKYIQSSLLKSQELIGGSNGEPDAQSQVDHGGLA